MATEDATTTNGAAPADQQVVTLTINAKEPTGCIFTSIQESAKVRTLNKNCGACANLWQGYEQFRWSLSLFCMKQPLSCLVGVIPRIGRICISQILCLIAFIILQIYVLTYEDVSDVDDDSQKLSLIGVQFGQASGICFGLVALFGQRNTLLNLIFGIPLERAIQYHRLIAYVGIFWAWLHFIFIIQYWDDIDDFDVQIEKEHSVAGLIMLASVTCIGIFAIDYVRRHYWELFLKTHWILFCTFFWAAWKHEDIFSEASWLLVFVLWVLDLIWRSMTIFLWGNSGTITNLEIIPGGVVKVTWERENFTFEGGQYAFICIPAIDLTQWHPFSISSGPDDKTKTFHIRALGDFTEKLEVLAKQNVTDWTKLHAYLEGPYGITELPYHRFESVILISGGIGITPMQSIWSEIMTLIENGQKFKEIQFVWYCRRPDMVDEFDRCHWDAVKRIGGPDQFVANLSINGITLKTTYVFTKGGSPQLQQRFGSGYKEGRPHVKEFIDAAPGNRCVLGCGPGRMLDDIKNHCASNGIACHTEVFNF